MSLIGFLSLLLNLSMGLVVLGFGLHASITDLAHVLKRPKLLGRSIFAMNVVMPVIAIFMVALFNLPAPLKIAIVALALSPVPPFLPKLQSGTGSSQGYILSLMAVAALCSIVVVPAGVWLIGEVFNTNSRAPAVTVIPTILISVILPLVVGICLRRFAPALADQITQPVAWIGTALMVVSLLPVVVAEFDDMGSVIGSGTLLILAIFSALGLAVGHYFGGTEPEKGALAMATAVRHPGVALAIATATFPEQTDVLAVVLWHVIVGAVFALGYIKLMPHRRRKIDPAHT